jgi:hypothetical protein
MNAAIPPGSSPSKRHLAGRLARTPSEVWRESLFLQDTETTMASPGSRIPERSGYRLAHPVEKAALPQ